MKLLALMALSERRSASLTELYLQSDLNSEVVFIEVWVQGGLIGCARLVRVRSADEIRAGRLVATFELAELLSAHSPYPSPLVSLSAVSWFRQELHEELSESRSFARPAGSTPEPLPQSTGGGCPHEA